MKKLFQTLATFSLRPSLANRTGSRSTAARHASRRFRPRLETLEDRALLTAYTAATAADLVADINAANKAGGASTIALTAPTTSPYILSAVDNNTNGANGLPVIGTNNAVNVTIIGNGDTVERNPATGTPAFRLFNVAGGSSLMLESVTLENGLAQGSGASAEGGAIYNLGSLTLIGATLQGNTAQGTNGAGGLITKVVPTNFQPSSLNGQAGGNAAGGAIWSSGSVTLEGGTVLEQNQALGGQGGASGSTPMTLGNGGAGGSASGGGLDEAGGSVTIDNATLAENAASGGAGGDLVRGVNIVDHAPIWVRAGAGGAGDGLCAAQGTLNVSSVVVQANHAFGGNGGSARYSGPLHGSAAFGGAAYGGGIDFVGGTAALDMTELLSNAAMGGTGGGSFTYGGHGGDAFGGGLYVAAGALTLTDDTVTGNEALGGFDGPSGSPTIYAGGAAAGGGIDIAAGATVSLDSSTLNDTANNNAGNYYYGVGISNINGTYILLP
jgi:hypothetical protein